MSTWFLYSELSTCFHMKFANETYKAANEMTLVSDSGSCNYTLGTSKLTFRLIHILMCYLH